MTLTAPNCPAADFLVEDARIKLESIEGIKNVNINIVFEPEWNKPVYLYALVGERGQCSEKSYVAPRNNSAILVPIVEYSE